MPEPSEPDTYMKDDASEAYAAYPTRTCEWEIDGEVPSGDLRLSRERQTVSFRHTEVGNQCGVAWTQVETILHDNRELRHQIRMLTGNLSKTTDELGRRMQLLAETLNAQQKSQTEISRARQLIIEAESMVKSHEKDKTHLEKLLLHQQSTNEQERQCLKLTQQKLQELKLLESDRKRVLKKRNRKDEKIAQCISQMQEENRRLELQNCELAKEIQYLQSEAYVMQGDHEREKESLLRQMERLQMSRFDKAYKSSLIIEQGSQTFYEQRINEKEHHIRNVKETEEKENNKSRQTSMLEALHQNKIKDITRRKECCTFKILHRMRIQSMKATASNATCVRRLEQKLRGKDQELKFLYEKYLSMLRNSEIDSATFFDAF